jgi:hypothetical protein
MTMIFDRQAKYALIVACLALLASSAAFKYAVGALNIYLRKEPVAMRASFTTISRTVGQWQQVGEDETLDDAVLLELGTKDTLSRAYAINGDPREGALSLHVAYYTGLIDAIPHIPDRCFVAAGMEPQSLPNIVPLQVKDDSWKLDDGPPNRATGEPYRYVEYRHPFTNVLERVRMPVGGLQVRLTQFARKDQPSLHIFGGFLFIANGRVAATPEAIRALAFKPSERHAYYCKVQFVYMAPGATSERYVELVSDFLQGFLPELMLRLPDWQEVEQHENTSR